MLRNSGSKVWVYLGDVIDNILIVEQVSLLVAVLDTRSSRNL